MYVRAPVRSLRFPHERIRVLPSSGLAGLGYYDQLGELHGFGSKLKKAVKKVAKVAKKVVKIAAPVAGFVIAGPAGAAVGGALARGVQPGGFNIKLAARGAFQAGAIGVGVMGAQARFAKFAASRAAMAAASAVPTGVGTGALATVAPAAQAAAAPSVWSGIFSSAVSVAKPVAINFARDMIASKIMGSRAEEAAAAEQTPSEPTYYPYPVRNPDGSYSAGAVPAGGGGGFVEAGRTAADYESEALTEAGAAPQIPPAAILAGTIALGLLLLR